MNQELIEKNNFAEILDRYIILINYDPRKKNRDIQEIKRQYELFRNLDPKYPENITPLKQALLKVYSSGIMFRSKSNIFSIY